MRSASGKGVLSEERWNRMHCRRTGRHFCCGERIKPASVEAM